MDVHDQANPSARESVTRWGCASSWGTASLASSRMDVRSECLFARRRSGSSCSGTGSSRGSRSPCSSLSSPTPTWGSSSRTVTCTSHLSRSACETSIICGASLGSAVYPSRVHRGTRTNSMVNCSHLSGCQKMYQIDADHRGGSSPHWLALSCQICWCRPAILNFCVWPYPALSSQFSSLVTN